MLDDELVIETPERVELHYVLANVGNRFLAAAIDHLIQAVLLLAVILIFAFTDTFRRVGGLVTAAGTGVATGGWSKSTGSRYREPIASWFPTCKFRVTETLVLDSALGAADNT